MLLTIQISILLLYNKKKKMDLLFFQKKKKTLNPPALMTWHFSADVANELALWSCGIHVSMWRGFPCGMSPSGMVTWQGETAMLAWWCGTRGVMWIAMWHDDMASLTKVALPCWIVRWQIDDVACKRGKFERDMAAELAIHVWSIMMWIAIWAPLLMMWVVTRQGELV